jgi:hypothetical protein
MEAETLKERIRRAETALRGGRAEEAKCEYDALAGLLSPTQKDAIRGQILHGQLRARSDLAMRGVAVDTTEELEAAALSMVDGGDLGPLQKDALLCAVANSALQRGDVQRSLLANRRSLECLLLLGESGAAMRARLALAQACFERGLLEESSVYFRAIVDSLSANPHFVSRPAVAARYKAVSYLRMSQAFEALGKPEEARREAHEGLEVLSASDPKNAMLREELQRLLERF